MENDKLIKNKILKYASFSFFFIITTYKLTNSSLWFDEVIEYWYSKIMVGTIPFESSKNMYERIVSTFQPPLYNFLMYFWLKISDSEWWFRFFGVVCGFIGMVGLRKSILKLYNNETIAGISIIVVSCIYQLVYIWQECSEYCLMLGSLFWTVFCFICLLKDNSRKNIMCFIISAIIPVYSQYGAAFPVLSMLIIAFIAIALNKNTNRIVDLIILYISAFFITAVPLYIFFFRKQIMRQQGNKSNFIIDLIEGLSTHNIGKEFITVFRYNFFTDYSEESVKIILLIIFMLCVCVFVNGKSLSRWIIATNMLTWIIYYIAVVTKKYAYGSFGNRYNCFFIPMWIVSLIVIGYDFSNIVMFSKFKNKDEIRLGFIGVLCSFAVCFTINNWDNRILENWEKGYNREVVEAWYRFGR